MRAAVIGLGFGDEGKGRVTSYLCSYYNNPLVVRYSGGHQAGHHVVDSELGVEHTFANFGSGSLQGAPTYWSKHCTFDPIGFMNEYDVLKGKVGDIKIYIHEDCPVTTPLDRKFNQAYEKDHMHGTCGVGFGATLQREEDRIHFHFEDLFNPTILLIKMELVKKYYNFMEEVVGSINMDEMLASFTLAINELYELLENGTIEMVDNTGVPSHPNTIYEGSQGLLLDQDIGFFPHVTRSNVGRKRLDHFIFHYDDVWYVTRAYQTRHGEGPISNLDRTLVLQNATGETNLKNEWQGEFRRTYLDVDLLKYALKHDRKNVRRVQSEYLVITCLDQMLEWKFTEGRTIFTFQNEQEFVENLVQALEFKGMVYLSRSSEGNLIEWKGGNNG